MKNKFKSKYYNIWIKLVTMMVPVRFLLKRECRGVSSVDYHQINDKLLHMYNTLGHWLFEGQKKAWMKPPTNWLLANGHWQMDRQTNRQKQSGIINWIDKLHFRERFLIFICSYCRLFTASQFSQKAVEKHEIKKTGKAGDLGSLLSGLTGTFALRCTI